MVDDQPAQEQPAVERVLAVNDLCVLLLTAVHLQSGRQSELTAAAVAARLGSQQLPGCGEGLLRRHVPSTARCCRVSSPTSSRRTGHRRLGCDSAPTIPVGQQCSRSLLSRDVEAPSACATTSLDVIHRGLSAQKRGSSLTTASSSKYPRLAFSFRFAALPVRSSSVGN